ncbi:MAG: rRNA maturation RNase YbeY [Pseudomonadota bacterium]|nr:rRNA maturation RNase YbeY [Pseudomonadota bacterium]
MPTLVAQRARPPAASGPRLVFRVQRAVDREELPSAHALRKWARAALRQDAAVTLRFVGAAESARLNATYRGKASPTNVLTFVYDDLTPLSGDLVLCVPVLEREARQQGKSLRNHCAHLLVHGMLHLQGDDHQADRAARRMEARETAILAGFGIPDPHHDPYVGPVLTGRRK